MYDTYRTKFGAELSQVKGLLQRSQELGLNCVGISFHAGSGCYDATAYSSAIAYARKAFDMALELGKYDYNLSNAFVLYVICIVLCI